MSLINIARRNAGQQQSDYYSHLSEENILDELKNNASLVADLSSYLKSEYGIDASTPDDVKREILSRGRQIDSNLARLGWGAMTTPDDPHRQRMENLVQRVYDKLPSALSKDGDSLAGAVGDVAIGVITDPVTWLSAGLSVPAQGIKAAVTKASGAALKEGAEQAGKHFLAEGTTEAARLAGRELAALGEQGITTEIGRAAMKEAALTAAKRDAMIEAPLGAGAQYADQSRRVDIGLQDHIDPTAVALGGLAGGALGGGVGGLAGAAAGRSAVRKLGSELGEDVAANLAGRAAADVPGGRAASDAAQRDIAYAFEEAMPSARDKITKAMEDAEAAKVASTERSRVADEEARAAEALERESAEQDEAFRRSLPRLSDEERGNAASIIDSLEQLQWRLPEDTLFATRMKTVLSDNDAAKLRIDLENYMSDNGAAMRARAKQKLADYDGSIDELTADQVRDRDATRTWLNQQDRLGALVRGVTPEELAADDEALERLANKLAGFKKVEPDADGAVDAAPAADGGTAAAKTEEAALEAPAKSKPIEAATPAPATPADPTTDRLMADARALLETRARVNHESLAKAIGATPEQTEVVLKRLVDEGDLTPPKGRQKHYQRAAKPQAQEGAPSAKQDQPTDSGKPAGPQATAAAVSAEAEAVRAQAANAQRIAMEASKQRADALRAHFAEVEARDVRDWFDLSTEDGLFLGGANDLERLTIEAANTGESIDMVLKRAALDTAGRVIERMNEVGAEGFDQRVFMVALDAIDLPDAQRTLVTHAYREQVKRQFDKVLAQVTARFGDKTPSYEDFRRYLADFGETVLAVFDGAAFEMRIPVTPMARDAVASTTGAADLIAKKTDAFFESIIKFGVPADTARKLSLTYRNTLYNNYGERLTDTLTVFVEKHATGAIADKAKKALASDDEAVVARLTKEPEVAKVVEMAKQSSLVSKVLTTAVDQAKRAAKDSPKAYDAAMKKVAKALQTMKLIREGRYLGPKKADGGSQSNDIGTIYSVQIKGKSYQVEAGKDFVLKEDGKDAYAIMAGGKAVGSVAVKGGKATITVGEATTSGVLEANINKIVAKRLIQNDIIKVPASKVNAPDGTIVPPPVAERIAESIADAEKAIGNLDTYRDVRADALPAGMAPDGYRPVLMRDAGGGKYDVRIPKPDQTFGQVAGKSEGFVIGVAPANLKRPSEVAANFSPLGQPTKGKGGAAPAPQAAAPDDLLAQAKLRALTEDEMANVTVEVDGRRYTGRGLFMTLQSYDGMPFSGEVEVARAGSIPGDFSSASGGFFDAFERLERAFEQHFPHGMIRPAADRIQAQRQIAEMFAKHDSETLLGVRMLLARMTGDKAPIIRQSADGRNTYRVSDNTVSLNLADTNPDRRSITPDIATASHEIGHWAWRNILSTDDRIKFMRWVERNLLTDEGTIDSEFAKSIDFNAGLEDAAAALGRKKVGFMNNQFDNPNEVWANIFMAYATGSKNAVLSDTAMISVMQSVLRKIAEWIDLLLESMFDGYTSKLVRPAGEDLPTTVPAELVPIIENILAPASSERRFGALYGADGKPVDVPEVAAARVKLETLDKLRYDLERVTVHGAWHADATEMAEALREAGKGVWSTIFAPGKKWSALRSELIKEVGQSDVDGLHRLVGNGSAGTLLTEVKDALRKTTSIDGEEALVTKLDREAADDYEAIDHLIDLLGDPNADTKAILATLFRSTYIPSGEQAVAARQEMMAAINRLAREEGVDSATMMDRISASADEYSPHDEIAADRIADEVRQRYAALGIELSSSLRAMQDIIVERFIETKLPDGVHIEKFDAVNRLRVSAENSTRRAAYKAKRASEIARLEATDTDALIRQHVKSDNAQTKANIVQVLRQRSVRAEADASLPAGKTMEDAPKAIYAALEKGDDKALSKLLRKALDDGDGDAARYALAAYARMKGTAKAIPTTDPAVIKAAAKVDAGATPLPVSSLVARVTHRNGVAQAAAQDIATRIFAVLKRDDSHLPTNGELARILGRDVAAGEDPAAQALEKGELAVAFINLMRGLSNSATLGKSKAFDVVAELAGVALRVSADEADLAVLARHGDRNGRLFAMRYRTMMKDRGDPSAKLLPLTEYFPELDEALVKRLASKVEQTSAFIMQNSVPGAKGAKELSGIMTVRAPKSAPANDRAPFVRSVNPRMIVSDLVASTKQDIAAAIQRFAGGAMNAPGIIKLVRVTRKVKNAEDVPANAVDNREFGDMVYFENAGEPVKLWEEMPAGELADAASANHSKLLIAIRRLGTGDERAEKLVDRLMKERDELAQAAGLSPSDYEFAPVVMNRAVKDGAFFDLADEADLSNLSDDSMMARALTGNRSIKTNADLYEAASRLLDGAGDGRSAFNEILKSRGIVGISRNGEPVGVFEPMVLRSVYDAEFADIVRDVPPRSFDMAVLDVALAPGDAPVKASDDFAGWMARLDLAGASEADVSWFRKMFERGTPDAKDIDSRVQWGKYFNLRTVSENIRRAGANWIADFAQPLAGAGYFERQAADFAGNVSRIFDALDTLPGARTGMKRWLDNMKWWGKLPQTESEEKIVRALRRGDPSSLNAREQEAYGVLANEFRAELLRHRDAGIHIGDVTAYDGVKGYFPQVWDTDLLRKEFDRAVSGFKRYFIAENRRQRAEFGDAVERIPDIEAEDKARKLVLRLTEDRGGAVSPDGRGTYRDVMADQYFKRKIVPTVADLDQIGLEEFMVSNLRAITATYFDAASRRRQFHSRFGDRSHALYDYLEVAQGGTNAIADLLMNKRERTIKFVSPGIEDEMKRTTIYPLTKNPEEAQQLAAQVSELAQRGDSVGRDKAKAILMSRSRSAGKDFERRVDAIVNALHDFGAAGNALTGQDMKYVMGAFRSWQRKPMDSNTFSDAARVVSKNLRNVNAVTRLGFATLTSFTDLVYPMIRSGQMGASIKAWRQYVQREDSYRRAAKNIGVGVETLLHEYLSDIHGVESSRFTNAFFNANLMTPWTRINREIAALTAYEAFKAEQAVAQKYRAAGDMGNKRYQTAVRFLRRYGLAEYAQEGARTLDSIVDDQANEHIRLAVMKFTNEAVFAPNQNDIPLWAQTPWGALMFQFKSFPVMMGRLAGYAVKEAKAGNPRPLFALVTVAPAFGSAALAIKDFAQMRGAEDEVDPSISDAMSLRDRRWSAIAKDLGFEADAGDWDRFMGWYAEGMLSAGGLGLIADMVWQSAENLDNGAFGQQRIVSTLAGPTYGLLQDGIAVVAGSAEAGKNQIKDFMGDEVSESNYRQRAAARAAAGFVPLVGGNRAWREGIATAVGGEPANPIRPD